MTSQPISPHPDDPEPHPPGPRGAAGGRPGPTLLLLAHGASTPRWFDLDRPSYVLGRSEECSIVVNDPSVSRRHLALDLGDGAVRFRVLSQTNPTLLDGEPTQEGELRPGQTLMIGLSRLELHEPGARRSVALVDDDVTRTVVLSDVERLARAVAAPRDAARGVLAAADAFARIAQSDHDSRSIAEATLLETTRLTGWRAAMLGRVADGVLNVLATQADDDRNLQLPRDALRALDAGEPAFILAADGDESERIVIGLDDRDPGREGPPGDGRGLLVLGRAGPSACRAELALRIGAAIGRSAWRALETLVAGQHMERELEQLRFARSQVYRSIVSSARLSRTRRQIEKAARLDGPVRLFGEEGTERPELARFLHAESESTGPFVECYVRLLPLQRVEDALFGAGSAEVVDTHAPNHIARARGGTLYIDEPEHLPQRLQDRLAEVIAAWSSRADAPRFVVGHGPDADDADSTLTARLRTALLGVHIDVPPLRVSPDEVSTLTDGVLEALGPHADGTARTIRERARRKLIGYDWPGNVAQHRRVVERAAMRARGRPIDNEDLDAQVREEDPRKLRIPTLLEAEQMHIQHALELCGGNKRRVAQLLGIASSTLYEKLKRMNQA